jgi:hypothetical protein
MRRSTDNRSPGPTSLWSVSFPVKEETLSVSKAVIGQSARPEWGEVESLFQSKWETMWGWGKYRRQYTMRGKRHSVDRGKERVK